MFKLSESKEDVKNPERDLKYKYFQEQKGRGVLSGTGKVYGTTMSKSNPCF
jgi:hypothetical protein